MGNIWKEHEVDVGELQPRTIAPRSQPGLLPQDTKLATSFLGTRLKRGNKCFTNILVSFWYQLAPARGTPPLQYEKKIFSHTVSSVLKETKEGMSSMCKLTMQRGILRVHIIRNLLDMSSKQVMRRDASDWEERSSRMWSLLEEDSKCLW